MAGLALAVQPEALQQLRGDMAAVAELARASLSGRKSPSSAAMVGAHERVAPTARSSKAARIARRGAGGGHTAIGQSRQPTAGSVGVHLHAGGHGGNIPVVAFGHFIGANSPWRGTRTGADNRPGQRGALVVQVKNLPAPVRGNNTSPRCRRSVAPRAISAGMLSPIGEPLAILPPSVPACFDRVEAAARQLGPVRRPLAERGKGVV